MQSKLLKPKRQELILDLCNALSTLRKPEEVAEVLTDLLSAKETETIAKRLRIAELLVNGKNYDEIRDEVKVGYSTIARVNTWLNLSGSGFKLMLDRKRKITKQSGVSLEEKYDPYSWHNIKRRYSLNFWPQLLVEELIKNADEKQKQKIGQIFDKLEDKRILFKSDSNKSLYESFNQRFSKREKSS